MKTILVDDELLTEEDICRKYKAYVYKLAQPFGYRHGYEDARSEAMLALVQACRSFDTSHGVPFGAYMTQQVRFALRKFARRCPSGLHVPTGTQALRYQAHRADVLDKSPQEIVEALGCTLEMAKRVRLAEFRTSTKSLDKSVKDSNMDGSEDTLLNTVHGTADDLTQPHVDEFLSRLTERERYILEQHKRKVRQDITAAELGISQMMVSRTLGKIKAKAYDTFMMGEC